MKKILIAMVVAVAACVYAADVMITGFDAVTGIGTFKVVSDGTSATLTVDKLTVSSTASLSGAGITGNIPVAAITNALNQSVYTTNTLTGDGVTNVFIWATVGQVKVLKSITTTP
jgi:hypothetical protein